MNCDFMVWLFATNDSKIGSHMVTPRQQCLVAVFLQNELMVVGGYTMTDSIEIANIIIVQLC